MLKKQYLACLAVYVGVVTNVISSTIVNVALPTLAIEFNVSDAAITWVVNAMQMIIPMMMLTFSAVADRLGYRKIFICGTSLFLISSALCGFCHSFETLVAARVLQGIGAACGLSVNTALLRLIFPASILGRAMSVNSMLVAVSSASGPTVAGLLLSYFSWPMIFFFNIPFGIIALTIGYKLLPENERPVNPEPFDWISAVLNALVFGLLLYSVEIYTHGEDLTYAVMFFLICLLLGVVYIKREMHKSMPIFPVDLMQIPIFSLSVGTSICSYMAQSLALVSLPFFMHHVLLYDPVMIGMMMTPWPLATIITAPIAGRLIEKYPVGTIGTIGMTFLAVGCLSLIFLPANPSPIFIVLPMLICGVGFGLFQTPNNVTLISSAPRHRSGAASGMLGTARVVGQTLGTTMVALFFRLFDETIQSQACLSLAVIMSITAAIFSSFRLKNSVRNSSNR